MTFYLIATGVLTAAIMLYFRIAAHFNITDRPNERSSHTRSTFRGGGIVFPLAALLWFFHAGFAQPWMIAGLIIIAVVSFLDDLFTVQGRWRLVAQAVATGLMFFQLGVMGLPWYIMAPAYIVTLGWINAFNFMDGINAITPFYSLSTLATFLYLDHQLDFTSPDLLWLLVIAVLVFGFFNARKHARAFAGDVGSISMAYLLAFLMISLMLQTGRYEYVLLFAVYALDSIFTIMYRLLRRENIFKAHRSHLYQLLANELGWPHVAVSAIYAGIQLLINTGVIVLVRQDLMNLPALLGIIAGLAAGYLAFRWLVNRCSAPQHL